jgi:hypothetical protein
MGPEAQSKDPDTAVWDQVASRRSHNHVLAMLLKRKWRFFANNGFGLP